MPQGSLPEGETESKKPRRSDRLSQPAAEKDKTPISREQHLPSPVTHLTEDSAENQKELTATPPSRPSEDVTPRKTDETFSQNLALSSPPQDTQPLSQLADRHPALAEEAAEDEEKEGIWGYLVPLDPKYGDKPLVLKRRSACPLPETVESTAKPEDKNNKGRPAAVKEEETYEKKKIKGAASGGYLIGRHPECGKSYMSLLLGSKRSLNYSRHCCSRWNRLQSTLPNLYGE